MLSKQRAVEQNSVLLDKKYELLKAKHEVRLEKRLEQLEEQHKKHEPPGTTAMLEEEKQQERLALEERLKSLEEERERERLALDERLESIRQKQTAQLDKLQASIDEEKATIVAGGGDVTRAKKALKELPKLRRRREETRNKLWAAEGARDIELAVIEKKLLKMKNPKKIDAKLGLAPKKIEAKLGPAQATIKTQLVELEATIATFEAAISRDAGYFAQKVALAAEEEAKKNAKKDADRELPKLKRTQIALRRKQAEMAKRTAAAKAKSKFFKPEWEQE